MACYTFRTYEERRTIQRMWEAGVQAKEIAHKLDAPLSSIYSELREEVYSNMSYHTAEILQQ